jgi:hypothetical protein
VTAWCQMPCEVVEGVMSPDLLPRASPSVPARSRYYDLACEPVGEASGQLLTPRMGRCSEGVVAFTARGDRLEGEVSVFLWTDSETYLVRDREGFGWPLRLAELELSGPLSTRTTFDGVTGECRTAVQWGEASLCDVRVTGHGPTGTPSGHWLTPRRALHGAGLEGETRGLQVVRPGVKRPGFATRSLAVYVSASPRHTRCISSTRSMPRSKSPRSSNS